MQKENEFKEVFEKEIDEKTEEIIEKTEAEERMEENTGKEEKTEEKTEENTEPKTETDEFDDLGNIGEPEEMTEGDATFIEIEDDEEKKCHCGYGWGVAVHCAITAAICFVIFAIILAGTKKRQEIHLIIDDYAVSSPAPSTSVGTYYNTEGNNTTINSVNPEIDMAKQFHLNDKSEENSAKLGIECTTVDQESVSQGLPKGVYVVSVPEGSAAHIAGILAGDIITAVDGQAIENVEDLLGLMKTYEPGDKIRVSLVRYADGIVSKDVTVILSK